MVLTEPMAKDFEFSIGTTLPGRLGRSGVIKTPHGVINTPAFIPVGTRATLKAVLPESLSVLGAQAVLANAYHLYLQPGSDVVDEAGRGNCFAFSGSGVVFNCLSHRIILAQGQDPTGTFGIKATDSSNVTDCNIEGYETGISSNSANLLVIRNNTIKGGKRGLMIDSGDDFNISFNTIWNTDGNGMNIKGTHGNVFNES